MAKRTVAWIACVVTTALVLGVNLGDYALWDPDEAKHAEIAREMSVSGSWLEPTVNFEPYRHKPPFFYMLVAAAYRLIGVSELSARVVPAVAGCLTAFVAASLVRPPANLYAVLFLLASPLFVFVSRFTNLDALVTAFLMVSAAALCRLIERPACRAYAYVVHAGMALAVLAKGPMAWALLVPPIAASIACGDLPFRSLVPARGVAIQAVLVGAVALPLGIRTPAYLGEFLWVHNVQRFLAREHAHLFHPEPFWFFVPVIIATTLPWASLIPSALARALAVPGSERFLAMYAVSVVLFFSLSSGKLATYVLPAYPAFAVLVAALVTDRQWHTRAHRRAARLGAGLCMLLTPAALVYLWHEAPALRGYAAVFLPASLAGAWFAWRTDGCGVLRPVVLTSAAMVVSLVLLLVAAAPAMTRYVSDADLAAIVRRNLPIERTIAFRVRPFSFLFYTGRKLVYPAPVDVARAALYADGSSFVLTEAKWKFLLEEAAPGVHLHELGRNPRHVLYRVSAPWGSAE